jgi:outer membrane protein
MKRLSSILLAVASASIFLPVGCVRNADEAKKDPTAEMLCEIDTYRGIPEPRSLDNTISKDPTFLAIGDRSTTAAVQTEGPICRISLTDVLLTTLRNNRSIAVSEFDRNVAEDGIEAAKGIYDLVLASTYDYARSDVQTATRIREGSTDNALAHASTRTRDTSVSLSQLLPTGGVVSLFGSHDYTNDFSGSDSKDLGDVNPFNQVSVGVGIAQPLLKGFGPGVTNSGIRIAKLDEKKSREEFRDEVITRLATAMTTYWDLVNAINTYEVQRVSLERAKELLRNAVIKRDTGVEPPTVVLQAQAEVSRREALLIAAKSDIADASDSLKRMMNITEGTDRWNYNLIPIDSPSFAPLDVNETAAYDLALSMRPDYRAVKIAIEEAEIGKMVKKNSLLPELNLTADFAGVGGERSVSEAWDETGDRKYDSYNLGLELNFPLQNRKARAEYRQAKTQLAQLDESRKNLEDGIRLEVRASVRSLDTNLKLIDAYKAAVASEQANLESELKRYDVGFATMFEVLNYQEDLATAQVNYVDSIINYNKALIGLQKTTGALLEQYRVDVLNGKINAPAATDIPDARTTTDMLTTDTQTTTGTLEQK